jgi:shikimate kinase
MIFLIGFMGSGKTHWGRKWAAKSGYDFIDLDERIEAREQMNIEKIFDKKGESYFRVIEQQALHAIPFTERLVVSCGGGTPCFKDNMQWMNTHGYTVYLHANPAKLLENVSDQINKRPLIKKISKGEIIFFIDQKLKERAPFYEQAKLTLEVTDLNEETIFHIITQQQHA